MDDKRIEELYSMLDTRITTINERTKNHSAYIREFQKRIKQLEEKNKNDENKR